MLKKKYILGTIALLTAIALPLLVSAKTNDDSTRLSGGDTITTAGEFDADLFGGERLHLKNHLEENVDMYIALPELLPGQGLKLELFNNVGKKIRVENGNIETEIDGTMPIDAEIIDENLEELCGVDTSSTTLTDKCNISAFSSEEESYQLYFHIKADDFNNSETYKAHRDIGIELTLKEQYDSAIGEDDVPNKIQNAFQIEPGEYTGWVSTRDLDDYYKIEGLSDDSTLTVRLEPEREDSTTTSHVILFEVYDDSRKKVGGTYYADNNGVEEKIYNISVPESAPGELKNKATRYIRIKSYNSLNVEMNEFYTLSIEASGYSPTGGGGTGVNCAGYNDVSSSDSRCPAVSKMKEKGIMRGTGDGTQFDGSANLNRAALCAVILKFKGVAPLSNDDLGNLAGFKDISNADKGQWWVGIMRKAKEIGIISGFPDNTLRPADPVNRAQFFLILTKAKNKSTPAPTSSPANDVSINSSATAWYRNYVKFALDNDLVDLDRNNNFLPNQAMSRYAVADSIHRWFNNIGEN